MLALIWGNHTRLTGIPHVIVQQKDSVSVAV